MAAQSDHSAGSDDSENDDSENPDSESGPASLERGLKATSGQRSLIHRLRSGAIWLVLGRICSMGSFLGAHVLLGRVFSEADYAAYATAAAAAILMATLVGFGTPKILVRSLKLQLTRGNVSGAKSAIRSCFFAIALVGCLALIAFLATSGFIVDLPKWRGIRNYSLLVACWGCLSAACLVSASTLESLDDFRSSVLIGARNGGALTNLLFLVLALIAHRFGFLGLGFALSLQVALHCLSLAIAAYSVRRGLQNRTKLLSVSSHQSSEATEDPPPHNLYWFLKESWPNFIVQITTMTIVELQIILLGFLTTERAIADYNAVLRLLGLINTCHALATTAIAPFVAELIAEGNKEKLERLLRSTATLVAIPTLAVTCLLLLFPEFVLASTFKSEFAGGAWALRIAAIGSVVSILSGSNGLTLIMSGQQKKLMRYSLVASLAFVILAIPATQRFGINGAAFAMSFVFSIYNIAITLLVKRQAGVWTLPTFSLQDILLTYNVLVRNKKIGR